MEIEEFFSRKYNYVVVGATANENKYGYKIFKALLDANWKVFGINPKTKEILGQKVYWELGVIPQKIDVVDFVTQPKITLKVLEDVKKLGIKKVWFQPGSWDAECINFCMYNHIDFIKDFCLLKAVLDKNE